MEIRENMKANERGETIESIQVHFLHLAFYNLIGGVGGACQQWWRRSLYVGCLSKGTLDELAEVGVMGVKMPQN